MKSENDVLAIRDRNLRQRIQQIVQDSNGQITIADIMRAALEEKLARMEQTGKFEVELKPHGRKGEPPRPRPDENEKSHRAKNAGGSSV